MHKGIYMNVLIYMEGEQDAPQDFQKLAIDELRKRLDAAFESPTERGLRISIQRVEEATGAVDELADKRDQARGNSPV